MTEPQAPSSRLRSLDALRGFDMLLIVGIEELIRALAKVLNLPWMDTLAVQFHHVDWVGLRTYDLIFPLFMFASGMSVAYAMTPKLERGVSKSSLLFTVWKRAFILVLLGVIYNGGLSFDFATQRYASVLGQIGLAYGIAATVFICLRSRKAQALWCLGTLLVIAILQLFIPVPGHGAGILTSDGIINAWFDRLFLPGRLHGVVFDPEGLLCLISASALTLGGVMTGDYIRSKGAPSFKAVSILFLIGGLLIGAGWLCWELGYPPIKSAWTTTFNLLAGGICLWAFLLFHLLIDFYQKPNWSLPLQIVGMNSLTIYLATRILSFHDISEFFLGGIAHLSGEWAEVVILSGILLLEWLFLWFLWKKRTFLRV